MYVLYNENAWQEQICWASSYTLHFAKLKQPKFSLITYEKFLLVKADKLRQVPIYCQYRGCNYVYTYL